jgi:hypothetical protein
MTSVFFSASSVNKEGLQIGRLQRGAAKGGCKEGLQRGAAKGAAKEPSSPDHVLPPLAGAAALTGQAGDESRSRGSKTPHRDVITQERSGSSATAADAFSIPKSGATTTDVYLLLRT